MRHHNIDQRWITNGFRQLLLLILVLTGLPVSAQIKIGGSVYGGGNAGDVEGNATVTLRAGNLNKVFGGARMADIDGYSFVHIDGANASDYMLINYVYAGNDISGTVGKLTNISNQTVTLPNQLEKAGLNKVDKSWDAFVRISTKTTTNSSNEVVAAYDAQKIYIGQLFGGGNGDYDYGLVGDTHTIYQKGTKDTEHPVVIATSTTRDFHYPDLGKTYLEILGGSIVYAFGGGNNATVTEKTIIHVENPSEVVYSIKDTRITSEGDGELLTDARIAEMGYNPGFTYAKSPDFQIGSFFGGNNRAPMAIRPVWNLLDGKIRNLYSGGNEGDMTSLEGILIDIPRTSKLVVNNIYGGCRKANVIPGGDITRPQSTTEIDGYAFPAGFAAHLTLKGGDINNIYGGNDISGKVFGGTSVGIYTSIRGNVYGGGNGSYPYTDNADLKDDPVYGELYYGDPEHPFADGNASVEALNNFRPNAEQVSLFVTGYEDPKKHTWTPTIIHGSVYLGGNSATLATQRLPEPIVELKIGSHVFIDNVFLGNNGYDMVQTHEGNPANYVHEGNLKTYQRTLNTLTSDGWTSVDYSGNNGKFTQMNLKDETTFAKYMDGCAMPLMPSVVFVNYEKDGLTDYIDYSTYIGSFYCGGNVGSMIVPNKTTINFNHKVIIYDKLVGGCNNAYVPAVEGFNAAFSGGLIGSTAERASFVDNNSKIKDRLELNLNGLKIQPKRWKKDSHGDFVLGTNGLPQLEWNTFSSTTGQPVNPVTTGASPDSPVTSNDNDIDRRFHGGNIYGGCYQSGYVNGNVVININAAIVDLTGDYAVFDRVQEDEDGEAKLNDYDEYHILQRRSGVLRDEQGMDVLGTSLNVFGGGYGLQSEIKGSTTINLNKGYVFQIFGGGEMGAVGMHTDVDVNGKFVYEQNPAYSTTVNLNGLANLPGVPKGAAGDHVDMAEAEFIYGGGFEGLIAGNTRINLNNGRVFDTFAGSCNADILGHTETYIGSNGFPYIRDDVYGGNDLGGRIYGDDHQSFKDRVRDNLEAVHGYNSSTQDAEVLTATAYIEYTKGRVDSIFGGCYGYYNYKDRKFSDYTDAEGNSLEGFTKPRMDNAFINFRPELSNNPYNKVLRIFGAGQGFPKEKEMNLLQNRSYILIDIPQEMTNTFQSMDVFGAGAYSGLGMGVDPTELVDHQVEGNLVKGQPDKASAVIDLFEGRINDVFGASYKEGVTRCTVVNVPIVSTIKLRNLFGGAYGTDMYRPCDVYESNVNYQGGGGIVNGAIYGGNNNERRTIYSKVDVSAPIYNGSSNAATGERYLGTVYGAGLGGDTWSEYTEVNLKDGARVYEVYGGGQAGKVHNAESVQKFMNDYKPTKWPKDNPEDPNEVQKDFTDADWKDAWTLGEGYDPSPFEFSANSTSYVNNAVTNLSNNALVRTAEMDDRSTKTYKYNTNVIINQGAEVSNYAYGGGLGSEAVVAGTTYIALLGGTVGKDIYAAGTSGSVEDLHGAKNFIASANIYIEGGSVRNVFGGGWEGSVGHHVGALSADNINDIPGETHVVIGIRKDQTSLPTNYGFLKGVPAILRNAYGGGEGGAVYGTTNLTFNNGYIGYYYEGGEYKEKIHDETYSDETHPKGSPNYRLEDCGNLYGGGYDDNSNVDHSYVTMWGGLVRNSLYGGGEIATIGRGATKESGANRTLDDIYFAGSTNVEIYNGHVKRDVYGGGKGFNLLGYGHKADKEKRYTDGYVFGQTAVNIYGGEIGTLEGIADGYGNVFGGGNIGYVYSPSYLSTPTKNEKTNHPKGSEGCAPDHWYYYDANGNWTEDCKVVVSPRLQVKPGQTVNGKGAYEYVETAYLNTLQRSSGVWDQLFTGGKLENGDPDPNDPERGVIIHNAVFAGGNVSSNSDQTYANATTVFGNTTATLYDVYHRDFITIGTEHTGGLYGGGNLSMVDGYRELNITNYGTDFYRLQTRIELDEYKKLSNRERAYFKLQYVCVTPIEIDGINYTTDHAPIDEDVYQRYLDEAADDADRLADIKAAFTPYGFCSIYAGRLLNTIQRADFCGVFGSRLVLQGAKDRVAEVGDATEYTINRVGELSLNLQRTKAGDTGEDAIHGNYFGIYSVVNRLGNLTSDVRFNDANHPYRDKDGATVADKTYYTYKEADPTSLKRNIGSSYNKVALASGVFLEMTTEKSTADHKDYGYITGVVELDLINVKRDQVGGGFVYAKNVHGVPSYNSTLENKILSPYNRETNNEACTYKQYSYSNDLKVFETSGNFIHPTKRIVDDCYPTNNAFDPSKSPYSEAHYWYVKGDVYIYDVNVSAYTGSANAYSKEVKIPLTITAASHGKLRLMDVKPNLYAYDALDETDNTTHHKIGSSDSYNKAFVNGESDSYELNDVITWWDWHNLKLSEQNLFRKKTYVNCVTCKIDDGTLYEAGTCVMDEADFATFKSTSHTYKDAEGQNILDGDQNVAGTDYIFRSSNNISHDTGYVLTFDMSSPKIWDDWYSPVSRTGGDSYYTDATHTNRTQTEESGYIAGPTFKATTAGVYGRRHYSAGEIITEDTYENYCSQPGITEEQKAVMQQAYVATQTVTYTYNNQTKTVNKGSAISKLEYDALDSTPKAAFGLASVCINTLKLDNENYLLLNDLVAASDIATLKGKYSSLSGDIDKALIPAYIITSAGEYGGKYYDTNTNYSAINAWSSLNSDDRQKFTFNYDAFDVLSDPNYMNFYETSGDTYPHHETTAAAYKSPYSDQVDVEYDAVFQPDAYEHDKGEGHRSLSYAGLTVDEENPRITSKQFENIIKNDQRHYTRVNPQTDGVTVYFAKVNFDYMGVPYGKGQVVDDPDLYNHALVEHVTFDQAGEQYYCYENYNSGSQKGSIISKAEYEGLPNDQKYFIIQGKEPTGLTTLYVSSESDINDLTKEKIITVVYQYTYYEDEDDGGIKQTNELHVVNIHLQLESGLPRIGVLNPPPTVLPGYTVGLTAPKVDPGLYEPLGNGWELFANSEDAVNHLNGVPFDNGNTPVYWYQNEKAWVAFYSRNYLGKTYSNPVPIRVANYHDLDAVMKDKDHHMYVDHPGAIRNPKIYIDNRDCESNATKSELDLLKDLYDLSLLTTPATSGTLQGHAIMDTHVKGLADMDFILSSDVSPKAYTTWTPIGNAGQCFEGALHGDGYMISGLSNSLFGTLCGSVYNLGVTGSFTSAGIADTGIGYVENCWINTTGTPNTSVNAVFGNPSATDGRTQVVNCYYEKDKTTNYAAGLARPMTDQEFHNGTVAYNLNGYYLNKRYYDHEQGTSGTRYDYLKDDPTTGQLTENLVSGYYPANYAMYPLPENPENPTAGKWGYVEERYAYPDFIYAGGTIPETAEPRMRTVTTGEGPSQKTDICYAPIWPDDYLFFGQTLTYRFDLSHPHQKRPSRIMKSGGRLLTDAGSNRVYRAPAYFGNKEKATFHYNPQCIMAAYPKKVYELEPLEHQAYPGMTAVDFAGHSDKVGDNVVYNKDWSSDNKYFFQPLLDDDGLLSISNNGETHNLLIYAPSETANKATYDVLNKSFKEPDFDDYYEPNAFYSPDKNYGRVAVAPTYTIFGHLVQSNLSTTSDHLLVDKESFNCPIAYTMGADYRMWYQRAPDKYVTVNSGSNSKGWENISLPFEVELVSTQEKGELTHFYNHSTQNNLIGHEYWLREYGGGAINSQNTSEFIAKFNSMTADESDPDKEDFLNQFLWDYYYNKNNNNNVGAGDDRNGEDYKEYYKDPRTYKNYPLQKPGTPYLIGFPGVSYFEFDLSGEWIAPTTASPAPVRLDQQIITFASKPNWTIGISDTEIAAGKTTKDGYAYVPNYLNKTFESGGESYLLNSDGNSFIKNAADATVSAFRPYIVAAPSQTRSSETNNNSVEQVVFGSDDATEFLLHDNPVDDLSHGALNAYGKKGCIVVESTLRYTVDVSIYTPAGLLVTTIQVMPNETVETSIYNSGVYIVRAENYQYVKKLIVKSKK